MQKKDQKKPEQPKGDAKQQQALQTTQKEEVNSQEIIVYNVIEATNNALNHLQRLLKRG